MSNQTSVADIFRRAVEIRQANPNGSFKDVKDRLVSEFDGRAFPPTYNLTIPELDNIAPEEDWTAGLSVVLRGIQMENWAEVAQGIIISLEQVENYPKQSGREDDPEKEWHNRQRGIADAEMKNLSKWLPEDLMNRAQRAAKK